MRILTQTKIPREFALYLAASLVALAVDYAVFVAILNTSVGYVAAAASGYCVGCLVAYALSARFVFDVRRYENQCVAFVVFAALGVFGLIVTVSVIHLAVDLTNLRPELAKLVAAGASFVANFFARKVILFTRPSLSK